MNSDEERRQELYSLLGVLPSRTRPVKAQQISRELADTYVLEKLVLDLNGIEPVPAYFSMPLNADGPVPVILYNHAHGVPMTLGRMNSSKVEKRFSRLLTRKRSARRLRCIVH